MASAVFIAQTHTPYFKKMQYAYVAASILLFHNLIHLEEQKIHKLFFKVRVVKHESS